MAETLYIASALLIFTTLAPHIPGKHWLIRVWEFPRVQQLVVIVLVLIGWALLPVTLDVTAFVFIAALVAAGMYQVHWILPYTFLWKTEVPYSKTRPAHSISLMTSNVLMHNDNSQGLIDQVSKHQPDMLIALETNQWWEDELTALHEDYPHRMGCPLENLYGMHLYSKLPFEKKSLRFVVEDEVPSMQVDVLLDDIPITVYFLHPKPPSPTENETAGPRDVELAIIGKEVAKCDKPVIVAGDLNDVAWSPTTRKFRALSHAKDPRIGRGFFNTFHAEYPVIRWPLDHVFHSDDFTLLDIKRLEGYGSDHFPLYIHLSLTDHIDLPREKTNT
ncbi:endonuclease/exonuclease/phosphatase family protein [Alteromonas halophila]|uniref:Endonuclease n=1 Tax=Alteromonas halophila TaxID=516698 RepID=A0A918JDX5_9ALTE|nr:endonuclease/exonuclease/phosphatase family protein [Alteromonas halophila]GGW76253.1 endonuclease [Alteromonas halophila]